MEWLKEARTSKEMTQEQVADECGIVRSYYTMIENGTRTPHPDIAKKIADVLGFDWTKFYEKESA